MTWLGWTGIFMVASGCNVFDTQLQNVAPACTSNQECVVASDGGAGFATATVCVKPEGKCVALVSEDCTLITGDSSNDNAILLGSLFQTSNAQGPTNLQRQESAAMAIDEIDDVGGVPGAGAAAPRPLVLVSCDEAADPLRAARHLVDELHVPAIIGPNVSQDVLDLTNTLTASAGTAMFTPTGVASTIAELSDNGLTFQMVPTDAQRAGLLNGQIGMLEPQLKSARSKSIIKLGVIYRDDAFGIGTRTGLSSLVLNGKPLSDPINLGQNVRIDPYPPAEPNQADLVSAYVAFLPDIIVLAGAAEMVAALVVPIEQRWPTSAPRPYYMATDAVKVPDLLAAVNGNDDFRHRIRGTGVTPDPGSAPVYQAFKVDYAGRYPSNPATISGMGSSYDAAYTIAFALAATTDVPVSGHSIVAGLAKLSGGGTSIPVGPTTILNAFQQLTAGNNITAIGTFAPLEWDARGAIASGLVELWCIGAQGSTPVFASSGLFYNIKTQSYSGTYTQCAP